MDRKKSTYTVEEARYKLEQFCVYQDRCHQEVEQKLRGMGMIPEACDLIQLHLIQHDFINEERFAKSFSRGKFRIKKWGRRRIINELKRRDVSAANIETGLEEIDPEDYNNVLEEIARKRFESIMESNAMKKRKKAADFLLRRGFESDKVYRILIDLEGENKS